jgi:hypothetical protein
MKQTAVDWLIDTLSYKDKSGKICINIHPDCDITPEIKKAKEMEKEQMYDAYEEGYLYFSPHENFNEYYNENYGDDT